MNAMRISFDDIKAAVTPPATGVSLMLLSILGFIVGLWVIIVIVRVVTG